MSTCYKATLLQFLILYANFIPHYESMPCTTSRITVQKVNRCPRNQLEWIIEAEKANCSSINQTCVKSYEFVYHCVLNTMLTELLEVCAPAKPIYGKMCAEYNIGGNLIQESLDAGCGTDRIPCPPAYPSTEAYKYQECYNFVKQSKNITKNNATACNIPSTDTGEEIKINLTLFVFLTLVVVCLNAGISSYILLRNKKRMHLNADNGRDQFQRNPFLNADATTDRNLNEYMRNECDSV
ncbi:uncharacterized protein LOC134270612 isoform X2 [Saccostrea cucullata]|uniref:uncharacterized protein LOC134270612 isoform X2 n=1 Tax=Saccostrea cuccullata TaxID=36930 RepID=UPI002ED28E00